MRGYIYTHRNLLVFLSLCTIHTRPSPVTIKKTKLNKLADIAASSTRSSPRQAQHSLPPSQTTALNGAPVYLKGIQSDRPVDSQASHRTSTHQQTTAYDHDRPHLASRPYLLSQRHTLISSTLHINPNFPRRANLPDVRAVKEGICTVRENWVTMTCCTCDGDTSEWAYPLYCKHCGHETCGYCEVG